MIIERFINKDVDLSVEQNGSFLFDFEYKYYHYELYEEDFIEIKCKCGLIDFLVFFNNLGNIMSLKNPLALVCPRCHENIGTTQEDFFVFSSSEVKVNTLLSRTFNDLKESFPEIKDWIDVENINY